MVLDSKAIRRQEHDDSSVPHGCVLPISDRQKNHKDTTFFGTIALGGHPFECATGRPTMCMETVATRHVADNG